MYVTSASSAMSTRGDYSTAKQAPITIATFPQGIVRTAQVRGHNLRLGSDKNVVPQIESSPEVQSLDFPLISKTDVIIKAKSDDKLKGDFTFLRELTFLRRSASNVTSYAKNSSLRQGKPQNSSRRKPQNSVDLYSLYTKTASPDRRHNSHERLRMLVGSSCVSQGLTDTPESIVLPHTLDDRLQKWIQHVYKTRRQHLETRDTSRGGLLPPSSESPVVGNQSTGQTFQEHQLPFQDTRRRSSLTKPRRRSSTIVSIPENGHLTPTERPRKRIPQSFRWVGFVVRSVVGLLMRMQKLSISKTHRSAYSEFLYIMAGPKTHAGQQGDEEEGQSLLFDKAWFSRTRAWSRMPTWAQAVMRLPPDERIPQDVQHLKQLLSNMRSFRENITDEMRTQLCQVVQYTRCDQGRIVFRQGHVGCDFYFIFTGSLLIQSNSYNDKTGEMETLVENVLRAGEGFGEIALLGDGLRTASVICKEPTELCQIDKATFLKICPSLFSDQLQERLDFARQFDIFTSWDHDRLKQLCFHSQVLDVPHSRIIDKNCATSKFAYFVMKGKVSMLKEFDVTAVVEMAGQRLDQGQRSVVKSKGTRKEKVKQFASVGILQAGDSTDLSVLALDPRKDIAQITLISEGVRLFRVTVRTFLRLSPRVAMEEYLKTYEPRKFPSENELFAHYLTDLNWSQFKKSVVHTNRLEKSGRVLASIPATVKGTSGWARWPGYAFNSRFGKPTRSIDAVAAANLSNIDYYGENVDDSKDNAVSPRVDVNLQVRRPERPRPLKPTLYLPSTTGS